jgi:hypothetical protein
VILADVIPIGRGVGGCRWEDPGVAHAQPLPAADQSPIGESRWPPVLTVIVFMVVNITVRVWMPQDGVLRVPWVAPLVEAILIVVLLTSDPSSAAERRRPSAVGCVRSRWCSSACSCWPRCGRRRC